MYFQTALWKTGSVYAENSRNTLASFPLSPVPLRLAPRTGCTADPGASSPWALLALPGGLGPQEPLCRGPPAQLGQHGPQRRLRDPRVTAELSPADWLVHPCLGPISSPHPGVRAQQGPGARQLLRDEAGPPGGAAGLRV